MTDPTQADPSAPHSGEYSGDSDQDYYAKVFQRTGDLDNPPRYFVMGDSHSLFFAGAEKILDTHAEIKRVHEGVRVYHLGSGLATSLAKKNGRNLSREKVAKALPEVRACGNPPIVLVFGEMDCRFSIRERARAAGNDTLNGWMESAQISALRYISFIMELKLNGFRPFVYGPVASTPRPADMHQYYTIGTTVERNWISIQFTGILRELCRARGVEVISLIDKLVDDKLNTIPEFSSDDVHLSQRYWPLWEERTKGLL